MIILKIILTLFILIALPILIGWPIAVLMNLYNNRPVWRLMFSYVIGFISVLALFQLVAVPLVMHYKSLTSLTVLYGVMLAVLVVLLNMAAVTRKQNKKTSVRKSVITGMNSIPIALKIALIAAVMIFLIAEFQYIFRMHIDDDDARYIGNAATAVHTDTMFQYDWGTGNFVGRNYDTERDLVSPYVMIYAVFSKVTGISPGIIAHTIIPPFMLMVGFLAYLLMGDSLFKRDNSKTIYFILLVGIIYMTFSGNTHTQAAVSLVRIWQGKAAFAAIVVPTMFYLYSAMSRKHSRRLNYYLLLMITSIAGCCMSGAAIVGTGVFTGVFCLWDIIIKRKWKELPLLIMACLPTLIYGFMYWRMKG